MGLDVNGTRFMLYVKSKGVDFSQTGMIGRQLLRADRTQLHVNLFDYGIDIDDSQFDNLYKKRVLSSFLRSFIRFMIPSFLKQRIKRLIFPSPFRSSSFKEIKK